MLNCQGWSVERYNRPSVTLCLLVDSNLGKLKITGSVQTPRWNPMMLPWLCCYGWSYGSLTPKIIDPKEGRFDDTQRSHVPTNFTDTISPRKNVNHHDSICLGTCARFAVWETWKWNRWTRCLHMCLFNFVHSFYTCAKFIKPIIFC